MDFKFLFGSQSGTSEVLAFDMQDQIPDAHTSTCDNLEEVDIDILNTSDTVYIFVVATYGEGEYTHSAESFFDTLTAQSPDLSHTQYAVFGLGDTAYENTYNHAAKNAAKLMSKLGAKRLGSVGMYDASSGALPEEYGIAWIQQILNKVSV